MKFSGISKVFSTVDREQYETIGAFWDELSEKYGMENLRGLGYNWTDNSIEYAIGLKDGAIDNENCNIENIPNENKMDIKYEKKYFKFKENDNLSIKLIKQKELEMQKEIDFLKKEILLKNDIIKNLIEENKNLTEKIKLKEKELLSSKNKEENLTKIIQENNKCITNLNQIMLKIVPKNKNKKNMNPKNNIFHQHQSLSKSIYENSWIPKNKCSKIKLDKSKEKLSFNKENTFIHDKENNKNNNDNSAVQRYFKIHHTR